MTPIHTILDQIRWDPRLDQARFEVVWRDRADQVRESVSAFLARGEVPLHRIQQVWCDGEMVWDRQTRLDRLQQVASQRADRKPIQSAGFWNVEEPGPDRLDAVVEAVLALQVDVLGLCEVNEPLLSALQARLGLEQVLLSAGPIAAIVPKDRSWQAVSLPLPGREALLLTGADVAVAVAHLTSDVRGDRAARREQQLEALQAALPRQGTLLVLLDANTERDLPELEALGLVDMGSPATFDPGSNPRAHSRTPEPRRLDRVLVRGQGSSYGAVVRHDPPLSDHWALRVGLGERQPSEALGRSPGVALVILPPESFSARLDLLRKGRDQAFGRWPPHVTVLHPFVSPEHVQEAVISLALALAQAEPFALALPSTGRFSHSGDRYTLWASPVPAAPLLALRGQVEALLPHLREGRPYTPHLTLAAGQGPPVPLDEAKIPREPWPVEALTVLVREGERFEAVDHVPLGGGLSLHEALLETELWDQSEAWQATVELLRVRVPGELLVLGGSAWGTRLVGSDLDLLWRPPAQVTDPLGFLVNELAEFAPRRIDAYHAPRVKLEALDADIQLHEEALQDVLRAQGATADQRLAIVALKVWARRRGLTVPASVGWLDLVLASGTSEPEALLHALWQRLADPRDELVLAGSAFRGARPAEIEQLRREASVAAALSGAWRAVFRPR